MTGYILFLISVFTVTLPDASTVPGMCAGEILESVESSGYQWIRIIESDYAVLEVKFSPAVPVTAYNDSGEALAFTTDGKPLILSAYSDYWFWIRAESNDPVEFTVEYQDSRSVGSGGQKSLLLPSEMVEVWDFIADEEGKWTFLIRGTDGDSDLDLELYGAENTLWAGSYGDNSTEKLTVGLLKNERLQIVVSRFNKAGRGNYQLEIMRSGEMDELFESITADAIKGDVQRYKVPALPNEMLLELTFADEGDLDLLVWSSGGEQLFSSTTYMATEGILLPANDLSVVVEVHPYDTGEDLDEFPYKLNLTESVADITQSASLNVETGFGQSPLLRFITPSSGFYTISGVFDKLRDGDIRLFSSSGESSAFIMTDRGDERFCFQAQQGDTMWINPLFVDPTRGGLCEVSVDSTQAVPLLGIVHGRIDETTPAQMFYTVQGQAGSTLVIELRGDQRNFDLDMLVSGPGYILQAEGGVSNADNAADESVTLYCEEDAVYGVTVYAYARKGKGTYTITAERIPMESLPAGDPDSAETWAIVSGISGYESRSDILSRASMDAVDFYRFLRDEQGIDSNRIILLVDAEARADVFRDAVEDISARADSEDRLIIFYSGHGAQEPPGYNGAEETDGLNEVLCFYDHDVSDDEMQEMLDDFSGSVYLFADACNSGGFVNDFTRRDNILILTAAREDKSVSERVLTPILLDGSRGAADQNNDGVITAEELIDFVEERMARICPVCDSVVDEGIVECPDCGTILKGEYRIPRPEQGLFLDPDEIVWK